MAVARDDGHLIGIIEGQVGIDKYQKIRHGFRERQSIVEERPGVWVSVEDDCQK